MNVIYGIASLPLWLAGLVLVVVPTLVTVCGPLIVRQFFPVEDLIENNEVAGFKFATLGVVYAVLLGLAVISVWEKFADAQAATAQEAAAIASMYRLAGGLDEAPRQSLRDALIVYARSVVADDWPAMADGHQSPTTLAALNAIYANAVALAAEDRRSAVLLNALLTQLDDVTQARRERLHLAEGIVPSVIWLVLFIGATMTLGFTLFFGLRNFRAQLLMTGMLALVIFLALFVGLLIDHPFSGSVRVPPTAIALVIADFGSPPE